MASFTPMQDGQLWTLTLKSFELLSQFQAIRERATRAHNLKAALYDIRISNDVLSGTF